MRRKAATFIQLWLFMSQWLLLVQRVCGQSQDWWDHEVNGFTETDLIMTASIANIFHVCIHQVNPARTELGRMSIQSDINVGKTDLGSLQCEQSLSYQFSYWLVYINMMHESKSPQQKRLFASALQRKGMKSLANQQHGQDERCLQAVDNPDEDFLEIIS